MIIDYYTAGLVLLVCGMAYIACVAIETASKYRDEVRRSPRRIAGTGPPPPDASQQLGSRHAPEAGVGPPRKKVDHPRRALLRNRVDLPQHGEPTDELCPPGGSMPAKGSSKPADQRAVPQAVSVTVADLRAYRAAAAQRGMSLSAWLREAARRELERVQIEEGVAC